MASAVKPPLASGSKTNTAVVTPPPDTLGRYGKIVKPGDEVAHPLKLSMPFPSVGEVKVPDVDEMNVRDKLEQLAKLSDADIRTQLSQWPAYSHMSLRDEGLMLQRIQDFRDHHSKLAQLKAHEMGLLTLTPEQSTRFEKEYWDKRLVLDHDLTKQFGPIMKAREQKLDEDLFREFSVAQTVPVPPAPKTPAPAPALPKPVAMNKPSTSAPPIPTATSPAPVKPPTPAPGTVGSAPAAPMTSQTQ